MDNQAVLPTLIPDGIEDITNKGVHHGIECSIVSANVIVDDFSEDEPCVAVEMSPRHSSNSRRRRQRRSSLESINTLLESVEKWTYQEVCEEDSEEGRVASDDDNMLQVGVKVRIIKGTNEGKCGKIKKLTDKYALISIDGMDKDVRKTKSSKFLQVIPSTPVEQHDEDGRSVEATCEQDGLGYDLVSVENKTYTPEREAVPQRSRFHEVIVSDNESDEEDEYTSSDDEDDDDEWGHSLSSPACQAISENTVLLNKVKRLEDEKVKLTEDAFLANKTSEAALRESENLKDRLKCPVCFLVKEDMYVLMTCGHKICFECCWHISKRECPTCRRKLKKESHVMKRLYY